MNKGIYTPPTMTILTLNGEMMIANSNDESTNESVSYYNSIGNQEQMVKDNSCSNYDVWSDDWSK